MLGRPQSISDSAESESSEDAEIGVPTLELSFATVTSITLCSPRVFKTLISSLLRQFPFAPSLTVTKPFSIRALSSLLANSYFPRPRTFTFNALAAGQRSFFSDRFLNRGASRNIVNSNREL